jgi:hypothetical protein
MKAIQWLAILASLAVLTNTRATAAFRSNSASVVGTVVAWGSDAFGQTDVPADLTNAVAISAGIEHSLALRTDGTVAVWGAGEYNQTNVPPGLQDVVAISTRGYHNLALKADGTVVAWGLDNDGQSEIPPDLSGVVAVAAGGNHSLALKADGTVVAWGWDQYGEIDVPTNLANVVAIAAGSRHSLALKADGTVVVWGNPGFDITVPAGLNHVVAISAGRFYNLALKNDGTVVAWGDNSDGQTNVPPNWTNLVQVAAGGFHNLGLHADGTATGFGLNDFGQADIPPSLNNILTLAAGTSHSLAIVPTPPPPGPAVLAITKPIPNSTWGNAHLTVEGTAQSPSGIAAVFYQLNDGPWQNATSTDGFAHWSADVALSTSANQLSAYALNNAGNVSDTNTVAFTYQPGSATTLQLQITGNGRVAPDWTGGKTLEIGKTYHLTALPAKGWVFYQWTGDTNSFTPKLQFVMQTNMMLIANFVPNPYSALQGTFSGLFFGDPSDPQWDVSSAGALTLRLTANGAYSGKISQLSGTSSFSGNAHLDASDTNLVVVPITTGHSKKSGLGGTLQIALTDLSQTITGALQVVSGTGSTASTQNALFQGQRLSTDKASQKTRTYNFSLDPQTADAGPIGGSFGRVTVRPNRAALVALSLADQNATATAGSGQTVSGAVPFFAPLYNHKGLASGWLQLDHVATLSSNVLWFKAAKASQSSYPQGFLQSLGGSGSVFTPTKKANLFQASEDPSVQASAGTVNLEDGAGISTGAPFTVANGSCQMSKDQNPNSIALSFSPATGLLSGSFVPPGSRKRLPFKGLLISTNAFALPFATGYFAEPDHTGRVGIGFQ